MSARGNWRIDLERFASDQPIAARRPGPLERLTRFARKHTAIVMALPCRSCS